MNEIQKQMNWEVKIVDKSQRIIEMIGSTEDVDRSGDRMSVSGVKLENYLKNPIILANHNYGHGTEVPTVIGRALAVNILANQLVFKIQFAETKNALEWFYLYSEGYMKASSIGFIPLERKPNDKGGYDFTSWELLELSLVTVPDNPNAVARAFDKGLISKSLFDQMHNEVIPESKKEVTKVDEEQMKAAVALAVTEAIKGIPTPHDYTAELKVATDKIIELDTALKAIPVKEEKVGAAISGATASIILKSVEGIMGHCKSLSDLIAKDDTIDEGKEYSDEEIQKAVEEQLAIAMKGAQ